MNRTVIGIITLYLFLFVSCAPPLHRQGWMFYPSGNRKRIVLTANRYVGAPYRWGGATPRGFDCSGFVMYVYRKNGIRVGRSVRSQFRRGRRITVRQLKPGDLVFFQTARSRFSHVGIYSGGLHFIHAPSSGKNVSYASMRNSYWRKRYIGAVTYFQ
jgi:cell wall-associated NlpC family hydrolase